MELLESGLSILDLPTYEITPEAIQDILLALNKSNIENKENVDYYNKMLDKLWHHLTTILPEFNDQLLCSTCFYSLLSHVSNEKMYLEKILEIINNDNKLKQNDTEHGQMLSLSVSLCYGLYQSSYILQTKQTDILQKIMKAVFELLLQVAYEYSQYTFITFKIMVSFKKVIDTEFQGVLFNESNQIKLLNVINHNWENPITGVRSLVGMLLQTLLPILDVHTYEMLLKEVNTFYWNKAKYLSFTKIIDHFKGNVEKFVLKNNLIEGLMHSLSKPGLVSAGTDMYNAILDKINSVCIWKTLFFSDIKEVLCGVSFKAIENFNNYWCLSTLKKFPMLANVFIDMLKDTDYNDCKFYSTMFIIRQCNKLGLIERNRNPSLGKEDEMILKSMENCNPSIRSLGFEIICTIQIKRFPVEEEYSQILEYLQNNINADCVVLRISMLNNLSNFLTQLHINYLNKQSHTALDITNLNIFCKNLQQFVVESLKLNGNYQRKITSIKICHAIFKCFNETPRKRQTSNKTKSFVLFLKENQNWLLSGDDVIMNLICLLKDPANDVQNGALQLLSEYYSNEISDVMVNYLVTEGLKCLESKFFYIINCGQVIFKLIINILNQNNTSDCRFKSIEDICEFAHAEIILECSSNRNIVQSIENGKQLHSLLNVLSMVFEASIKSSYTLNIPRDKIVLLLDAVECISNQFDWEDKSLTSSDFSKINDKVQSIIDSSGVTLDMIDETKISGLHQIVLNCLWLNVKASCDSASILIQYYKHDLNICKKCLNIITHVLETSRHKGAIEAAGSALGRAINFLTSLKQLPEASNLPLFLLKEKLNDLFFETAKMSSVTRRGAGLSIMVHRIVSNDVSKGKPLFHYFMKRILEICSNLEDSNCAEIVDVDNEKDIPKAIYIHFLTKIVMDSSLASDMMYYSAQLAALAFNNLTNSQWQIRNAALQLYGALVPKLIGQKKASGTDDESIATVACDEFRTHSPKLWNYIIQQIENQQYDDILQAHSNLVPILNVLASIARRYDFTCNLIYQEKHDSSLLSHLLNLLGSPIYTVRRLTSQSIINIYSLDTIYFVVTTNQCVSANYLHGIILLISNCYKIYYTSSSKQLHNLIQKYQNIVMLLKHLYICKWNLEKLIPIEGATIKEVKTILFEEQFNRYEPGVSLWADLKIQNCLQCMEWNLIPDTLKLLISSRNFDIYCESLIKRIQSSIKPPETVLNEIAKVFLLSKILGKSSAIWKVLYHISLKIKLEDQAFENIIVKFINHPSYKMRYVIPFASRVLQDSVHLFHISETIFLLCNPEYNDVDMRFIAALSNNELAHNFKNHSDTIKINEIKSAIILLQDEDEDIRNLSVNFYKNITQEDQTKQPFICLNKILIKDFLFKVLENPQLGIQKICKDLLDFLNFANKDNDQYNPFTNEGKNIYLEGNILKKTLEDLSSN